MKNPQRRSGPILGLWVSALSLVLTAACAQEPTVWIADAKAVPDRFFNRAVVLEGRILEVTPNPPGTNRGSYRLMDDSDELGLWVRSGDLPAPGQLVRVHGTITQNPADSRMPILQENRRAGAGGMFQNPMIWVILVSGLLAVALLIALVWTLMRPEEEVDEGPAFGPSESRSRVFTEAQNFGGGNGFEADGSPTRPIDMENTQFFKWFGRLRVVEGPDAGREYPLGTTPITLGRSGARNNDVVLSDNTVSRSQARIVWDQNAQIATLINESRTNPTILNGRSVEAERLSDGDRIGVGASMLQFSTQGSGRS